MIQVIKDITTANARKTVVSIPSAAVSHLPAIMGLAAIREIGPGSDVGYMWDHATGTVMIIQPAAYRGRIDSVLRMLQRKFQPSFIPASQLREVLI